MNRPLAGSACLSIGVHLLILLPLGMLPPRGNTLRVDVIRGTSSVELVLVPEAETTRQSAGSEGPLGEGRNPVSRAAAPSPSSFLDEGVTVDWKAAGLKNSPPRYPWIARAQGWEGTVIVRARVGPEGRVSEIAVRKGSGHAILDRAALEAIRGWIFQPAQSEGKIRSSWVEIPVSFRLQTQRETKGEIS